MTTHVVVNKDGDLYGGFGEGKPHWFRTKREECLMDEATATKVVSQLAGLGFDGCAIRRADEVKRKWVRKDLDATAP